ncbi:two-component regulator propeller domain-containing protein [Edaphobacter aggregans]|uniref:two-component regulator propeller domain-containing protein n=1 Tax=Edaphobacter aggregans TaxID=570835 RepID=UPI00068933E8|nr:two-component regulator propeller domain-containing protein [Edaphobacter aggregans]
MERWSVIALGLCIICGRSAFALDPSLDINQYAHTAWKIQDGFTQGVVTSIEQTPDGYLWLGTRGGLIRFDGVRTVPWQPPAVGEQLPSNMIRSTLVSRDGTLWIGTQKGLASWKDGKLTQYPDIGRDIVGSIVEDREGTIWSGVYQPGNAKICTIRHSKVQCVGSGGFGESITALYEDHKGDLWAGAATGLWRWSPGAPLHYTVSGGRVEIRALIEDNNGVLLLATNDGLKQLVDGKIQNYPLPGWAAQLRPTRLFRSRDGSLWIGTEEGLLHLHEGRIDTFEVAATLDDNFILKIFQDREGNVWVSSADGLDRFRAFAIPRISTEQGLSTFPWAVQATPDGSVWIGTADGLNRWQAGHITVYGRRNTPSQRRRAEEQEHRVSTSVTDIANCGFSGAVNLLGVDDQQRLWISTGDGVSYSDGGRFTRVPNFPVGSDIAGDGHGSLWILNTAQELVHWTPHGVVEHTQWSRFKQQFRPIALAPDRSRGGVWVGFFDGGVAYLRDGEVRASYNSGDGLGDGRVNSLKLSSDGAVWAATDGGLSRVKDGHIITLTSKNGLPCDSVVWAMEDDNHSFWLSMSCGLARIVRSEFDAWLSDPKRTIQATVFDSSDGVVGRRTRSVHGPNVTKSPDGKIWFFSPQGVSILDPQHLPFNPLSPPVHVEQVTADGKQYDAAKGLRLPPHVRNLAIDYTALSLAVPERVRFRFKLEGQDRDWREVVNLRRVEYSNLPPRNYRFHVTASNNSGVWNEQGGTLEFAIAPAYYQTNWFRALCAAAFLALLWVLYRLRVRQLKEQEKKFREAIDTIPAMAFISQPDGYRTFVNRRWVEYTGLTQEQASGSGWQKAIHPDDLNRVLERWRVALAGGEPFEYELRFRAAANGVYRWFLARIVPLRDKRGKILNWYGVITDIEDRKRAEQLQADLAHIHRVTTMGELTASLAHEIKQPIAATVANADTCLQWLKRDRPDLDEIREAAKSIVTEGRRAAEIIERLRSLYKQSLPKRELVDVNDIVSEMVALLRGEANRYTASMRTDLAANLPKVTADRVQLQQVLMNLMLNGIEAMKETGGVLTVKSQLGEDGRLLISVSDTGVGLPAEKMDQIFDVFFTTKPHGSGMGLAISRSIIESHGGGLWAAPNAGPGATFYFALPTAVEEVNVPATGADSVSTGPPHDDEDAR